MTNARFSMPQEGSDNMDKITNSNLSEKWEALTRIGDARVGTPKFKWNIAKNKSILKSHRDDLTEGLSQDPKLSEYNNERLQVYDKWAIKTVTEAKNPDGSDGSTTQYRVPSENLEAFEADIEKLKEQYKDVLDDEKKRIAGIPELLKSCISVEFHKIRMSTVPIEDLNSNDVATLWELWEDDLEDVADEVESEEAEVDPPAKAPKKKPKS